MLVHKLEGKRILSPPIQQKSIYNFSYSTNCSEIFRIVGAGCETLKSGVLDQSENFLGVWYPNSDRMSRFFDQILVKFLELGFDCDP